jgi:peptide/nickel transport system permease protein
VDEQASINSGIEIAMHANHSLTAAPNSALRRKPLATRLWRQRAGIVGSLLLFGAFTTAVLAQIIAPADPLEINLQATYIPPTWDLSTMEYVLGSDSLGRDVLSRAMHGARVSLLVGFMAVLGSGVVGIVIGLLAGFYGGWVDRVVAWMVDVQMAVPFLALAILLVGILGPGLRNIIIALIISGWILYARVVRAETLSIREREWVQAAQALGASDGRIMFRHILPNIAPSLIVVASFEFARMILMEASLSFLGLGIQPPTPTWGGMISSARNYLQIAPWLIAVPGAMVSLTVIGANILGDWLRDVLDPRRR